MRQLIDLTVDETQLKRTAQAARERSIVIPTFAQMRNPSKVPPAVQERLKHTGLWDIDPANL